MSCKSNLNTYDCKPHSFQIHPESRSSFQSSANFHHLPFHLTQALIILFILQKPQVNHFALMTFPLKKCFILRMSQSTHIHTYVLVNKCKNKCNIQTQSHKLIFKSCGTERKNEYGLKNNFK